MGRTFYDGANRAFTLLSSTDGVARVNRYKVRFVPGQVSRLQRLAFPTAQPIMLYTTHTKKRVAAVIVVRAIRFAPSGRTAEITASVATHMQPPVTTP